MISKSLQLWKDDTGQDIAEYAVMLAVILVLSSFHPLTQRPSKQRIDFDAGEVCEAAPQNIGCQTRAWPNFQHIRAKINTSECPWEKFLFQPLPPMGRPADMTMNPVHVFEVYLNPRTRHLPAETRCRSLSEDA